MPPLRRSVRRRRTKAELEEQRITTREKKRREICPSHHRRSPSADMDLPLMVSGIRSDDSKLQLDATTQLLNLVSAAEHTPLMKEVIQLGAVPRLVEFLTRDDYPELQCEAARVLKNISSGTSEDTKVVIDCGAVPVFVKLLESSELETCEQVVWSLGNISGESFVCRDIVLSCGALHPLLTLLEDHASLSFLRIGTWTLTNIFEGGPEVPFEQLKFAIRVLASLILTKDEVVLKEACWALLYLSHCGGGIETAMYEADLCPKLAKLFVHAPISACFPALRAIRSILTGTETLDERAIEARQWAIYIPRRDLEVRFFQKEALDLALLVESFEWSIYLERRKKYLQELKDSTVG